ncbi:MAG TPA: prohibitin family protein [Methylomirabilota bacterium]|jgi:regulator of protease activity HflC (stomatin/prohibitin superfamily)|nr:prohibitin family protein [Methylomirabilota bacterium]
MGKLVFAGIILLVGLGLYAALRRERGALGGLGGALPRVVLGLAVGIPVAILVFSIFRIIPAGQVGVKVLFGQVEPVPLREGLNLIWNPLYDIVVMDARVEKHTAKYDAASNDLQAVHVEMVLNYRLMPDRAPEVYRSIGLGYSALIIDPAAQEVLKANTATHNAAEILLKRPAIKADIQRDLTAWLAKYGIELKEAALANIRFDANYEKAIEAKQIEEQKAEQKRYELIQAQRQAEIVAAQAKGKGDAAREEAKGVADALRIKGEAEAAYNAKVSASLTPVLIQQQYLARWDGRLPQYTLGSNVVPFLQVPGTAGDGPRR